MASGGGERVTDEEEQGSNDCSFKILTKGVPFSISPRGEIALSTPSDPFHRDESLPWIS
jgi:hypothetical protein